MPVKSIRFPNQTTYDGTITSLTEKEKEVLKKAVGSGGGELNIIDVTVTNQTETDYGGRIDFTLNSDIDPNKTNILNLGGSYEIITKVTVNNTDIRGYYYNIGHEGIFSYGEILGRYGQTLVSYYGFPIHFSHFITLTSSTFGSINFNHYNLNGDTITIDTLKTALAGKSVTCSGYIKHSGANKFAKYIAGDAGGLSVGWFDISDGSTGITAIDDTFSISDKHTPVIY